MYKTILTGILAAGLVGNSPAVKNGIGSASLLDEVKTIASQGQDAQTAAQVSQYVDQNANVITAVFNGYLSYIKKIEGMTNDDGTGTPQTRVQANGTAGSASASQGNAGVSAAPQAGDLQLSGGLQSSSVQASSALESSTVQPSGGLQASSVRPSGGLQMAHLAGYPALPDVDPTSSVKVMTADQIAYAAWVRKLNFERKQELMMRPAEYSY